MAFAAWVAPFFIWAQLTADFTANRTENCPGGAFQFTDASTGGALIWSWTFPGGEPDAWEGLQPPLVTWYESGVYTVNLFVSNGFTLSQKTMDITVLQVEGLPFAADMGLGPFPPAGWQRMPEEEGPGTLAWTGGTPGCCGDGIAARLPAFGSNIGFAEAALTSPFIDLTNVGDPYLRFKWSYAGITSGTTELLRVGILNCDGIFMEEPFFRSGEALATNGGMLVGQPWVPQSEDDWAFAVLPLEGVQGNTVRIEFSAISFGGQDIWIDEVEVFNGSRLHVRVLLSGAYESFTGLMTDDLRSTGLLPFTEPYTELGEALLEPVPGQRSVGSVGADALTDWVVLEVRDALQPTRLLTSRVALVQRDGDVVDLDGTSRVRMGVPTGEHHVSLRHRNHLGVMSAAPVPITEGMPLLDLSDPTVPVFGTQARTVVAGTALLWAGDASSDGIVRYTGSQNDRDAVLGRIGGTVPTSVVAGYFPEDVNLDGVVKYTGVGNDRDPILNAVGGTVPTAVRNAQLP